MSMIYCLLNPTCKDRIPSDKTRILKGYRRVTIWCTFPLPDYQPQVPGL